MKAQHQSHKNPAKHKRAMAMPEVSVVDLILIDHQYLKKRFSILKEEDADPRQKLTAAKEFLDVLGKHSQAEKKTLYAELLNVEALHAKILEGEVEHGIVDQKVRLLTPKLARIRHLTDELTAELKVLAELVEHHVQEEEREMLPLVNREIDSEILLKLGKSFMKMRKFTPKELKDRTNLFDQFTGWKESAEEVAHLFVNKLEDFSGSFRH